MGCQQGGEQHKKNEQYQPNTPRPYITVPYYRGLSESFKKKCSNYGVQVFFRGGNTIKNLLMAPKGQRSYDEEEWGHLQL